MRCFVCHCDYYQRLTGSVGVAAAVFHEKDVSAVEGTFGIFTPQMPQFPGTERYFCSNCGSALYWVNPTAFPDLRLVALGCFDDPSRWGLARSVQNQYRPAWCPELDAAERHDVYGD